MIEPLTAQVAHGQYAASELREAANMISLIAQWDLLRPSEKAFQFAQDSPENPSRFRDVPGFEPEFCTGCQDDVFADYRNDLRGECPVNPAHVLFASSVSDQAAA